MTGINKIGENIFYSEFIDKKFRFNIITISFIVNLDKAKAGENALLCHLLKKSCMKYKDSLEIGKLLRNLYGCELSCCVKKYGNMQIISFTTNVLDNEYALAKENLTKKAINLLEEIILRPKIINDNFTEKEVEIEKENILNIINSLYNDKEELAFYKAEKILFEGTDLAIDKYGDVETLKKITNEDLKQAYYNLLKNSEIFITYTGRNKYEHEISLLLNNIKNVKRNKDYKLIRNNYNFCKIKEKTDNDNILQAKLIMGFSSTKKSEDQNLFYETCVTIFNALFGGTATSLLFNVIREKRSLCYYCRSFYDKYSKVIWVTSGVENKNIETAKKGIQDQLERIKLGDFSEENLAQTIYAIENAYKQLYDSPEKVANYYLICFLKRKFATLEEILSLINNITKDDIVETSKDFSFVISYVLKSGEL